MPRLAFDRELLLVALVTLTLLERSASTPGLG